jgi:hypothetical protein
MLYCASVAINCVRGAVYQCHLQLLLWLPSEGLGGPSSTCRSIIVLLGSENWQMLHCGTVSTWQGTKNAKIRQGASRTVYAAVCMNHACFKYRVRICL